MSIIETLTEGIVNRNMQEEGAALLNKWSSTGLLEGLSNENDKQNMARLLENQAKELLRESNTMAGGSVEGFAAVAFPIVRRVFAGLIANDLVSVQPMSLPSGLIFFLDFTFTNSRMGNTAGESIYGTDRVGSAVTGGVNLVDARGVGQGSGPLRAGATGYAYASPSGSNAEIAVDAMAVNNSFNLNGAISERDAKAINYDADLLAVDDGTGCLVLDVKKSLIKDRHGANQAADFNNLSAFLFPLLKATVATQANFDLTQVRRLTQLADAADSGLSEDVVRFVFVLAAGQNVTAAITSAATPVAAVSVVDTLKFPIGDNFTEGGALGSIEGALLWGLEGAEAIPEAG
jgi:hypothetical protein